MTDSGQKSKAYMPLSAYCTYIILPSIVSFPLMDSKLAPNSPLRSYAAKEQIVRHTFSYERRNKFSPLIYGGDTSSLAFWVHT